MDGIVDKRLYRKLDKHDECVEDQIKKQNHTEAVK